MKIKNYFLPFVLIFLLSSAVSTAQKLVPQLEVSEKTKTSINPEFCGTDFFHNEKMNNDPAYKKRHLQAIEDVKKIASQPYKKAANGIAQIPVVVHVMHKGEAIGIGTNISDEDVKKGIQYLNNYWRKVSGSNGSGDGVDMKIEFALAIQDPNGNCTNGIDRVNMSGVPAYVNNGVNRSETNGIPDYEAGGAVNSLKEYGYWNSSRYYNVWLVDEIDNKNCFSGGFFTAGYAYFAGAHGQRYDGSVVITCSYLDEDSTVWAHEMGHAFNLPHTFDGDDSNNDGEGDKCGDDGIADTPKHIRTSSIAPSIYFSCANADANACDPTFNQVTNPDTGFIRNTGTHQDHMHNYMDYTGCDNEFTGGQRTVAAAALAGVRASFLTSPALTPATTATVFFTASATAVCAGSKVDFFDESTCTPNTYTNAAYDNITFLWTFDNKVDPPFTSTLQNPSITFNTNGIYDVTLAITNPKGTTSLKKTATIAVTAGLIPGCAVTSSNKNNNFGIGVTSVSFNSLTNVTTTSIPANAKNDFACTKSTTVFAGTSYPLTVKYKSRNDGEAFLEVWIDWNNNGIFETLNNLGINEKVLANTIVASTNGNATVNVVPPANAVLNTILRMRVVTEHTKTPTVCGSGFVQRADDYGVLVKAACTPPTAAIANNNATTVLTCLAPSISLTASGGVSYSWNNNKGINPTIAATQPGTYTVTVTAANGCTDTESIVITENKPAPTAVITNNTGSTTITCAIPSISVTASGGTSYSWDNGLGTNATATFTSPGTYTVTVTGTNACTATKSIVIADQKTTPTCSISSTNNNGNYGCGVTNVVFNTINKTTTTIIPPSATQNFVCSDQTTLSLSTAYNLNVTYRSRNDRTHFLAVWIDWDNNGVFETSNSSGVNERVVSDNIPVATNKTVTASITPPASAVVNTLLRMRVISELGSAPAVCGSGLAKRTDDYGVTVANPLSTNNFLNSDFIIYPNPVKENLILSLKNNEEIMSYQIYDITGKTIIAGNAIDQNTISVSNLPKGLYILTIKTTSGEFDSKFLKE